MERDAGSTSDAAEPGSDSEPAADEASELSGGPYREQGIQDTPGEPLPAGRPEAPGELRAAKEYAEMLVDAVREGLLVLDLGLQVLSANQSFYDLFEVTPEETAGQSVFELGEGEWDVPELRRLLDEILPEEKELDDFEVARPFPSIGYRVMRLSAQQVDEHELILLAIEDITDRRRAEERMTRFFSLTLDLLAIASLRTGYWERVNAGMTRVLGWSEEELLAMPFLDIVHPDDLERSVAATEALATGGTLQGFEHRVRCKDGSYRWIQWETVPLPEEGLMYCAGRDMTTRRRAEEALRESEERYRTLFESMEEGFCVIEVLVDEQGAPADYRFVETNPTFEVQTGLTDAEGKTALELVPALEPFWIETYGAVALTGESTRFTNKAEPMERWFDVSAFRVGEPEERKVALLFSDITKRKEAEEALNALNQTLERRVEERTQQVRGLVSALTMAEHRERRRLSEVLHDDVQQLLYGARTTAHMVRYHMDRDTPESETRVRYHLDRLEAILDEAVEATRTLSIELNPPVLRREGLPETLQWLAAHMRERYGLAVELDLEAVPPVASLDLRALVYRKVRELLFNVVKHAGTDQAWVSGRVEAGGLKIEVRDEGSGFDPAVLEGQRSVGLYDIRERLESVGGYLEIDAAPGVGTRATIVVPDEGDSA